MLRNEMRQTFKTMRDMCVQVSQTSTNIAKQHRGHLIYKNDGLKQSREILEKEPLALYDKAVNMSRRFGR
jgi:hypothetical protein